MMMSMAMMMAMMTLMLHTVSGSIEMRQTERRVGRSDFHVHWS